MMGLLAFLGRALDRSRVGLDGNTRFAPLRSAMSGVLGGVGWVALLLAVILASASWSWYRGTHPTPGKFYSTPTPTAPAAVTSAGPSPGSARTFTPLSATMTPRMSTERVRQWLSRSLMDVYSFNFTDADDVLKTTRWVFRADTYESFMAEMYKRNGLVASVKENSLIVAMTPMTDVRVVKVSYYGQRRIWKMEMTGLLSFTGATKEKAPNQVVRFVVIIEEVPTTENPNGLGIAQIKVSEG